MYLKRCYPNPVKSSKYANARRGAISKNENLYPSAKIIVKRKINSPFHLFPVLIFTSIYFFKKKQKNKINIPEMSTYFHRSLFHARFVFSFILF